MTVTENPTVIASRYTATAETLVSLAVGQVSNSRAEVDDLIANLQEQLDDENLRMTIQERSLLHSTMDELETHANTLWRMSRA